MGYIENSSDFQSFMEEFGPNGIASRSNYISWLNFISDNGFEINSNLSDNDTILNFLRKNEDKREQYKSKDAYADFGSALNKYRKFILSDFTSITIDLKKIEEQEIPETEKEELRKARIGHGKYRKELIGLWNKCSVSKLKKKEFLVASHIQPWRNSTNTERLDKFNGLLLLPNYDKLFDRGYISFLNNGQIIISSKIDIREYQSLGISRNDKLFQIFDENIIYLEKHREIHKEQLFVK